MPAFHASRTVPVQQGVKVVELLKRMKKLDVIVRQEETEDWNGSTHLACFSSEAYWCSAIRR